MKKNFYCRRCGKWTKGVPGYALALWTHCPCGGVAIRQGVNKNKSEKRP